MQRYLYIREYKDHLKAVSMDRELEFFMQSQNPFTSDTPTLFIQIDGMDQSKWSIPRVVQHRGSKDLQKYIRPRLKIVGCWCSQYLLSLYIVDANYAHDSSLTCEVHSQHLAVFLNANALLLLYMWIGVGGLTKS